MRQDEQYRIPLHEQPAKPEPHITGRVLKQYVREKVAEGFRERQQERDARRQATPKPKKRKSQIPLFGQETTTE